MRKVTLDDIASELNTSKNTVSKALRGLPGVSDNLRAKIIKLAEETGYKKTAYEEKNISLSIALICQKTFFNELSFWSQVFSGIWEYTGKNNINIRTITLNDGMEDDGVLSQLNAASFGGYVVIGTIANNLLKKINTLEMPLVVIDHFCQDVDCDYINTANENGIYKAVKYLYKNNHRNIGFINNIETAFSFNARYKGYLSCMKELELSVDERFVWSDAVYIETGYYKNKINELKNAPDFPTAWVCVNDNTALAFYNALTELNYNVPDDVSIIGFDNISNHAAPFLTTIDVPRGALGHIAIKKLIERIENPSEPYESILVNTTVSERNSVKLLRNVPL